MNCPSSESESPEDADNRPESGEEPNVPAEQQEVANATEEKKKQSATTPFDLPFVFPALLFVLGLWFGYDGWFNDEIKSKTFNKIVACVFGVTFVWTLWVDITDVKRARAKKRKELEEADVTTSGS